MRWHSCNDVVWITAMHGCQPPPRYTDKNVFLRELISNAADALEKVRFHSVEDPGYLGDTKDLEIKIEFDPNAKTLSITDTGRGVAGPSQSTNFVVVAFSVYQYRFCKVQVVRTKFISGAWCVTYNLKESIRRITKSIV